jgi:DNA-binding beta-propeller fold protein YncE
LLRGGLKRQIPLLSIVIAGIVAMAGAQQTARAASVEIPRGSLSQLPGTEGCVSATRIDGCKVGRELAGAAGIAVSSDGHDVYIAANHASAVLTFTRDPRTGALAQLPGTGGCTSEAGNDGCATGDALTGAVSLAVSPDGHNVYAASDQGVAVFARNPQTGVLTQLSGKSGCVTEGGADGCTPGRALVAASSVAVSPDGHDVYVASLTSNAVAAFARDSATGALRQLTGLAACTSQFGGDGCQSGHALNGASSVAVAPDGKAVYVAAVFSNAIANFQRDPATGALSEGPGAACTSEGGSEGCATGRGINGTDTVAVAPDGGYVYSASSGSSGVAALLRSPTTGGLDQLPGPYGCTAQGGLEGCATGRGLGGAYSLALSGDGDSLYVAALNSLAIFARDPATGRILELKRSAGCVDERGREGCASGRGLAGAFSIAVSPDGKSVYVASLQSSAVAIFARAAASDTLQATLSGVPHRCTSHSFVVHAGAKSTLRLRSLRLKLNGRLMGRTRRDTLRRRINVARLKKGRYHLTVAATDIAGHVATRTATFKRC